MFLPYPPTQRQKKTLFRLWGEVVRSVKETHARMFKLNYMGPGTLKY